MADERDTNDGNVTNSENDAREQDIVKDTDADTKDIVDTEQEHYDDVEKRFSTIETTLDKILAQISSIREAQGILVENGAVINDTDDDAIIDDFVSPVEMNLLI